MIYLLFITLLILCIICYFINDKELESPSFAFSFGFLFQSVWAVLYHKKWNLYLNLNTYLVISLGVLEFVLISYIIKIIISKLKKDENKKRTKDNKIKFININKHVLVIYILFIVCFIGVYLYYIVSTVDGSFNSLGSISDAIAKYDNLAKFTDNFDTVQLPFLISNLNVAIVASGFWFLYVLLNNFIVKWKIDFLQLIIVILTIVLSMLGGSRTNAFFMIGSGIAYYLILLNKKNNYLNNINYKAIIIIAVTGIVFLSSFMAIAKILGRKIDKNPLDYLSIYCGAEVKNLDLFLQEYDGTKRNNIWGSQTFISLITSYGEKIGFDGYNRYRLDLPFRNENNQSLGNVYTTFYPFIYDFGYFGMFVLVFIMALLSQLIFELTKISKFNNKPLISILSYGIVFDCLILSFFSNKFYESIFSMTFVKRIIVWLLLNYVLCYLVPKIKFLNGGTK